MPTDGTDVKRVSELNNTNSSHRDTKYCRKVVQNLIDNNNNNTCNISIAPISLTTQAQMPNK